MGKPISEKAVLDKIKHELNSLQGTGNMNGDLQTSVAPIVSKLESVSYAFWMARKIWFQGQYLNLPIESALDNATFVTENNPVPSINLYLNGTAKLRGDKRVGLSITISKNAFNDAGVDLQSYVESLIVERVATAIEQSIFNGDGTQLGFLGIAKDASVQSQPLTINAATIDQLRSIQDAVHERAIPGAYWYMNRIFFNEVAKLKDANGKFYVKYEYGTPYLLGNPVDITAGLVDDSVSGNIPVVFGDLSMAYTCGIAKDLEVNETNSSTDAYQGTVTYVADMLVDGHVTNYAALAVGKVS